MVWRKGWLIYLCFATFIEIFSITGGMSLDKVDRQLLSMLQKDGTLSLNELAEAVNLTTTPCWKRLKKLEESGIIKQRVALLDPEQLGLSFIAFVMVIPI